MLALGRFPFSQIRSQRVIYPAIDGERKVALPGDVCAYAPTVHNLSREGTVAAVLLTALASASFAQDAPKKEQADSAYRISLVQSRKVRQSPRLGRRPGILI